jgi:hypothetical protein
MQSNYAVMQLSVALHNSMADTIASVVDKLLPLWR